MIDGYIDDSFEAILPGVTNSEAFAEALEIQQLGDEVIERMRWIQVNSQGRIWWKDKELIGLFSELYKSGCILLPKDEVERIRWIALLCLEFSNLYNFDAGTIILPFDFLTEDMFEIFEAVYPAYAINEVKNLRSKIRELGWETVFEV